MAGEKLRSLQIVRGVAATVVVWFHATIFAGWDFGLISGWGGAGVDLFFVLSGFVIYRTGFVGHRMAPRLFLRKRLTRIIPLYYALTLIWLPVCFLIGEPQGAANIAAAVFFWPQWPGGFAFPVIAQGWTLCFEMLFYLSALIVLIWPRAIYLLAAGFIGAAAFNVPVIGNAIILEFCFGALIGARFHPGDSKKRWLPIILACATAIIAIGHQFPNLGDATVAFGGYLAWIRVVLWGPPSALIVMGAIALEPLLGRGRVTAFLVYLGDASYSIYLAGSAPLAIAAFWIKPENDLAATLWQIALFGLSMAGGLACYQYVEKPLMQTILKRRPIGHLRPIEVSP